MRNLAKESWSYSRLSTFSQCKYCYYLKYILKDKETYPPIELGTKKKIVKIGEPLDLQIDKASINPVKNTKVIRIQSK